MWNLISRLPTKLFWLVVGGALIWTLAGTYMSALEAEQTEAEIRSSQ